MLEVAIAATHLEDCHRYPDRLGDAGGGLRLDLPCGALAIEQHGTGPVPFRPQSMNLRTQSRRRGSDHRDDPGLDGIGKVRPCDHDLGKVRIGLTGVMDTKRSKRLLM